MNVTPDSFSDGGRFLDHGAASDHGLALVAAGADVLDIGGESTRPGADPVDDAEERARVLPVIARLAAEAGVPVSVDTTKASVAAAALDAGAVIVNDVSAGLGDPAMLDVVAAAGAGYVAMHRRGEPRTMQVDVHYDDVVRDVARHLVERRDAAVEAGIAPDAVCVDPGIGFGKLIGHNLELLARVDAIVNGVDAPVLVGASRKAFLGQVLGDACGAAAPIGPDARDDATLATTMWLIDHGASVVRVHDVGPSADAVRLWVTMRDLDARAVA